MVINLSLICLLDSWKFYYSMYIVIHTKDRFFIFFDYWSTMKGLMLFYLQANMLACLLFMDASRKHDTPRSETKYVIIYENNSNSTTSILSC